MKTDHSPSITLPPCNLALGSFQGDRENKSNILEVHGLEELSRWLVGLLNVPVSVTPLRVPEDSPFFLVKVTGSGPAVVILFDRENNTGTIRSTDGQSWNDKDVCAIFSPPTSVDTAPVFSASPLQDDPVKEDFAQLCFGSSRPKCQAGEVPLLMLLPFTADFEKQRSLNSEDGGKRPVTLPALLLHLISKEVMTTSDLEKYGADDGADQPLAGGDLSPEDQRKNLWYRGLMRKKGLSPSIAILAVEKLLELQTLDSTLEGRADRSFARDLTRLHSNEFNAKRMPHLTPLLEYEQKHGFPGTCQRYELINNGVPSNSVDFLARRYPGYRGLEGGEPTEEMTALITEVVESLPNDGYQPWVYNRRVQDLKKRLTQLLCWHGGVLDVSQAAQIVNGADFLNRVSFLPGSISRNAGLEARAIAVLLIDRAKEITAAAKTIP